MDADGILRVNGRLLKSKHLDKYTKKPIILNNNHPFVECLIQHFHNKTAHCGFETVINELRQKYWIISMRNTVKKVIRKCKYCEIRRTKPSNPIMGQLPECRLEPYVRPFTYTGIDFFGPFYVTIGRRHEKRYGVIFTCLTIRAIHLEIANSLTTDSTILAIRRMIARRGSPRKFYSDNGTNFHGSNRELQEAMAELNFVKLKEDIQQTGIDWNFNPPSASHMGGAWERLIRTVRKSLSAIMKERYPKEEVLSTIFVEVEHLVNSRPLTMVSEDPDDDESLTPNHFLIGTSSGVQSPCIFSENEIIYNKQWRISQYLIDLFWRRWMKEYLPTLLIQKKWTKKTENMKIKDIVYVTDIVNDRGKWPLGIITKCFPGEDNVVRVVEVKTQHGQYIRPVNKLKLVDAAKYCVKKEDFSTPAGEC